ncbi:hypothetical protein Poli38472_013540 [Pythium oligandrum]|uniref:Uncharacterized protein n=1 Tax=Pythium oligandrum TaxID=41045 RepID=A0A8K1FD92_PYTOL|nr:hypothetical protein Poli38472_013540 [Pythium oligandrum]|eukprot:TMW58066.1 hypothetical protein Poli38472_013540 [Pythium oligandrum]
MLGATIIPRAGMQLNNQQYPPYKLVLIVSISLVAAVLAFVGIALCWRFPVPFTLTIALGPGCVILGAVHFVFLADLLRRTSPLRTPILLSWASVLEQCSQLVIYPAVSAVFEAVSEAGKIALTLIFPVIKYVIKKAVRKSGKIFGDSSEEMAVASVEISSSLYQSMIMQNSPSVTATAIIVGFDMLQGLLAVKIFMDKPSRVSRHRIIDTALAYIHKTKGADRSFRSKVDEVRDGDEVLVQALELLQSAENILFIEYFEVAIPLLNAAFLFIASQVDSALYNPKLAPFHANNERLVAGLRSLLTYTLLQALTLIAMCW